MLIVEQGSVRWRIAIATSHEQHPDVTIGLGSVSIDAQPPRSEQNHCSHAPW